MIKNEVTAAMLQEAFLYECGTGLFFRKTGSKNGLRAFTNVNADGYLRGSFKGRLFFAHRAAFAIANGRFPIGKIDHINGDRQDNRIENLREVSDVDNAKNSAKRKTGKSPHIGVYWKPKIQRWVAQVCVDYRNIHLGCFENLDDAIAARKSGEQKHGFHQNHGRLPAQSHTNSFTQVAA